MRVQEEADAKELLEVNSLQAQSFVSTIVKKAEQEAKQLAKQAEAQKLAATSGSDEKEDKVDLLIPNVKGRRSTKNRKKSIVSASKSMGEEAQLDEIDFESRFQGMFGQQEDGLLRAKTRRLRNRAGGAKNEEIDNEKVTDNSEDAVDF